MICEKKNVQYGANGMCKLCHQRVKLRILFAIKRRWTAKSPMNEPRTFTNRICAKNIVRLTSSSQIIELMLGFIICDFRPVIGRSRFAITFALLLPSVGRRLLY